MPAVLYLVFNPVAGKGRARRALDRTLAFLTEHGLQHTLLTTERPGHAAELAAATPPGATVVALGGDGTVHEVVKGIVAAAGSAEGSAEPFARTLGVVPVGSGDDFAYALGIPRDDLEGALQRLLARRHALVDVGFVDDEPFVNSTGVGFDAEAAHRVRTSPKAFTGLAAYLYGVLAALGDLSPADVAVTVDGELVYQGASLLVSVQNGPRGGGNFMFAPEARNDDGALDVVVAGAFGRLGAVSVLPRLMKGQHLSHPRVHLFRGARVELSWARPQRGHADGEPLGPLACYRVRLQPRALRVVR